MLRLVGLCLLAVVMHTDAVEIIAHRGASYDAPENTLASVKLGWQRGADAVEVDVYLSKDNKVVVIHDDNTKRTTGHDGLVHKMTLAQLQKLDAGSWKASKFKGEPIPSLAQVLKTVPDGKYLVIEVKCGPEIIEPLSKLFEKTNIQPSKTAIISFSYDVVVAAKKRFPNRTVYYLSGIKKNKTSLKWEPSLGFLIKKVRDAELDGLSLGFKGGDGDTRLRDYIRQTRRKTLSHKLDFYVWTVNDLHIAKMFAEVGVNGITTDRPAFLKPINSQ